MGTCTFNLEELPVEADGTFVYSLLVRRLNINDSSLRLAQSMGLVPEPIVTDEGERYEVRRISGQFDTSTSVTGIAILIDCGNQYFFTSPFENAWSAEWQSE